MMHEVPCITTLTGAAAAVERHPRAARSRASASARCRTTTQELPPKRRATVPSVRQLPTSELPTYLFSGSVTADAHIGGDPGQEDILTLMRIRSPAPRTIGAFSSQADLVGRIFSLS